MFELIHEVSEEYGVDSYSLSQDTLDSVFNRWVEEVDAIEEDD